MSDTPAARPGIQETPPSVGHQGVQHALVPGEHHGPGATPTPLPFTDAEWQEFQQSDIHGATVVVGLMAGIFLIGLLLYSVIAGIVSYANGPIA